MKKNSSQNRKTKEPNPLSSILNTFFNKHPATSDQLFGTKLWQNWSRLAMSDIAAHTKPVSYQKGRLVVWVANSIELQELSFHVEALKHKINSHFGKKWITDIHFTVNKDLVKKREQSAKLLQKIL